MKILLVLILLFSSSCSRVIDGMYNLGDKMPTYDGNKCNASVHCFGENRKDYGPKQQQEYQTYQPQEQIYQPPQQEHLPEYQQTPVSNQQ
jgi:hypothetical protein